MNDILNAQLIIPFANEKHAKIVYETLRVDQEPRKNLIQRQLSLQSNLLIINWSAKESRILRVSCQSILEHINSILNTIQAFELD